MRAAFLPRLASQCQVCRQWSGGSLCADCTARFAPAVPRCRRCALRLGVEAEACGDCLREPPPFQRTVCVADYGFPWQGLIADLKFHDRPELAATLAPLLTEAVRRSGHALPQWLLPVPLAPQRLAERGGNQAWEIARRCAAALNLKADPSLLQRPVHTPHQAELTRAERQRNLRSAFMVDPRRRAELAGAHVAVVDDVMTTGATAREVAGVLLRAGAATVDLWVLARTPPPQ